MNILFEVDDDDPLVEQMIAKGFRQDVEIEIDGEKTRIEFYDPVRLIQDIQLWMENPNFEFIVDSLTILCKDLSNEGIRMKVKEMTESGYFNSHI